jgi:hypothetical protein
MNFQTHRNLQEAYMEVYEQQKGSGPRLPGGLDFHHGLDADPNSHNPAGGPGGPPGGGTIKGPKKKNVVRKRRNINNSYDPYDLILSHLLDEGYAETLEAAESIMVNMSEEWRESIVEEVFGEASTGERLRRAIKKPGGMAYTRKVSADPTKRATRGGRGGESDFGAGDRGRGNRAARRAGTYEVPDINN